MLDRAGWPRDGRPGFVATGGSSGMLRVTFDGDAYRIDTDAGGAGYPLCVR